MNKILKTLPKVLCLVFALMFLIAPLSSAGSSYSTYTYSSEGEILYSPDAYVPQTVVDSSYIGLEEAMGNPTDIAVDRFMNVYIVDSGTNRVVVTDPYYKEKFVIDEFVNNWGVPDHFNNPQGIFVTVPENHPEEGRIFVADTDNNRIVIFDLNGKYEKVVYKPESSLFSATSLYKPCAIAVDEYGRLFIVSSTTYQGIIVMSENGDFYGFIGAQKVSLTAWEKIVRMFQTDEQKMYSKQFIPTEFNNIDIDSSDFLYVTISSIEEEDQQNAINTKSKESTYAPVKKINASGDDIMRRNGFYPPSGEVKVTMDELAGAAEISGASAIVDVAVGPEGTWSIIDEKRSKVYTYDDDGNLLFIYGDVGAQKGMIQKVKAVTYQGDRIILLDSYYKSFTVYRRTEYGDILMSALHNQNEKAFDSAYDDWMEILKRNNNFDLAYIGVGKALYRSGEFEESLDYFKAAYETENYSLSFKEIRKEWMGKFFLLIIVILVALFVLLAKLFGFAAKYNKKVSLKIGRKTIKDELIYAFHVIIHPFDGFWDLKHEQRGSVKSAAVLLVFTILCFFYQSVSTGYIFKPNDSDAMSIFTSIISVVVPVLLWTVGNWCMTTLMEGEGTLKNIFVATCYALVPVAIMTLLATVLSNVLLETEKDFVTMIQIIGYVWTGLLLIFGIMQTHDYSMGRNLLTILLTIVAMVFIMFVAILFTTLITKIVTFVYNLVVEVEYRV
ncbi:MAG: YIP1 family protein [Clostridia bacterium]|nr:YIP1 family protein [Clostridia bacterium]